MTQERDKDKGRTPPKSPPPPPPAAPKTNPATAPAKGPKDAARETRNAAEGADDKGDEGGDDAAGQTPPNLPTPGDKFDAGEPDAVNAPQNRTPPDPGDWGRSFDRGPGEVGPGPLPPAGATDPNRRDDAPTPGATGTENPARHEPPANVPFATGPTRADRVVSSPGPAANPGAPKAAPKVPQGPPSATPDKAAEVGDGTDTDPNRPQNARRSGVGPDRGPDRDADPHYDESRYWALVRHKAGLGTPERSFNVSAGAEANALTATGRNHSDLNADVITMTQRAQAKRERQQLPAVKAELEKVRAKIKEDTIGGPRQSARIEKERALTAKVAELETLDKNLIQTTPHRGYQQDRNALIRRIHSIDADSVAEGVDEDEADRRTADEREHLAELESKMAEF